MKKFKRKFPPKRPRKPRKNAVTARPKPYMAMWKVAIESEPDLNEMWEWPGMQRYIAHRCDLGHLGTLHGAVCVLKRIKRDLTPETFELAVDNAITCGYLALYEPRQGWRLPPSESPDARVARAWARMLYRLANDRKDKLEACQEYVLDRYPGGWAQLQHDTREGVNLTPVRRVFVRFFQEWAKKHSPNPLKEMKNSGYRFYLDPEQGDWPRKRDGGGRFLKRTEAEKGKEQGPQPDMGAVADRLDEG